MLNRNFHNAILKSGFTLIEFLIVMAIVAVLTFVGVASYNGFSRSEILKQAAGNLRSDLRNAQNRAASGEIDCSVSKCGGTDGKCGTGDAGEKPLDSWKVTFSTNSYTIQGYCELATFPDSNFSKSLPNIIQIQSPLPPAILFKPLGQGTNISSAQVDVILKHTGTGATETVTVTAGGEIR